MAAIIAGGVASPMPQAGEIPFSTRRPVLCGAPSNTACPDEGRGRGSYNGVRLGIRGSHTFHHPREHVGLAPAFPPIVQRLVRAVVLEHVSPPQAVAVDEHDAAQYPPIVDAWLAMALRKERPQPFHLFVRQSKQIGQSSPLTTIESDRTPQINGPWPYEYIAEIWAAEPEQFIRAKRRNVQQPLVHKIPHTPPWRTVYLSLYQTCHVFYGHRDE